MSKTSLKERKKKKKQKKVYLAKRQEQMIKDHGVCLYVKVIKEDSWKTLPKKIILLPYMLKTDKKINYLCNKKK